MDKEESSCDKRLQALMLAARRFAKAQMPKGGVIAELHLRPPELFLLFHLRKAGLKAAASDFSGLYPSDLAALMEVTAGHITQLITSLEKQGMVERQVDSGDRRKVAVHLTEGGMKALDEAISTYESAYRGLIERLGTENTDTFIALLEGAIDYFAQRGGNDCACAHGRCD